MYSQIRVSGDGMQTFLTWILIKPAKVVERNLQCRCDMRQTCAILFSIGLRQTQGSAIVMPRVIVAVTNVHKS